MSARRIAMVVLGLGVSVLFVCLAIRGIDLDAVGKAFSTAELLPWLPLALGLYVCGYFARGLRCRLLVRQNAKLGVLRATNIVVVGYAANNVLPARLGELVRAGMLAERTKIPMSQSLGITFIERVLDGLILLLLLVLATLTVDVPSWMHDVVMVAAAVFGIAAVVVIVGALAPHVIIGLATRFGGLFGARWRERFTKLATNVTNAGAVLRDPKQALALVFYSVLIWGFDAALYTLILGVFGIPVVIQYGIITMCVTGFGVILPSSPGFIGPFHFFASQALMVHGIAQSTALAYATLVHLAFFIPITIWGACSVVWYGVELSAAKALAQREAAAEATVEATEVAERDAS